MEGWQIALVCDALKDSFRYAILYFANLALKPGGADRTSCLTAIAA
jgi:hypothetical protein